MSLETLLEAAKYIEYRSAVNARGEAPEDFLSFLNLGPVRRGPSDGAGPGDADKRSIQRTGGACTREVHNKLEKDRRAHLKKCFETLKRQIPNMDERKTSNLGILRSSLRYIQSLKRKEREYEHETDRLARERSALQQRLMALQKDLAAHLGAHVDLGALLPDQPDVDNDTTNSTSTASECGPLSDDEGGTGVPDDIAATADPRPPPPRWPPSLAREQPCPTVQMTPPAAVQVLAQNAVRLQLHHQVVSSSTATATVQLRAPSSARTVRGLLTPPAPPSIAIPVANFAVKPAAATTMPTLTLSPTLAAATLNFQAASLTGQTAKPITHALTPVTVVPSHLGKVVAPTFLKSIPILQPQFAQQLVVQVTAASSATPPTGH